MKRHANLAVIRKAACAAALVAWAMPAAAEDPVQLSWGDYTVNQEAQLTISIWSGWDPETEQPIFNDVSNWQSGGAGDVVANVQTYGLGPIDVSMGTHTSLTQDGGQPQLLSRNWYTYTAEEYLGTNASASANANGMLHVGTSDQAPAGTLLQLSATAVIQDSPTFSFNLANLSLASDFAATSRALVVAGQDYFFTFNNVGTADINGGVAISFATSLLPSRPGEAVWIGIAGGDYGQAGNWYNSTAPGTVPDASMAVRFDSMTPDTYAHLHQDTAHVGMTINDAKLQLDLNGYRYALNAANGYDGGVAITGSGRMEVTGGGVFEATGADLTRDTSLLVHNATMSIAGNLVSASTDLAVRNHAGWSETGTGRLIVVGDFINRGVAYVEKKSASSPDNAARMEVGGTLTTSGPLFMRWGSLKAAQVRIQQDASVEPAWNVTGTWARLQASGRIEGNVLNVDGTINFPAWGENLVIQGDLTQQAGGLMIWGTDASSRYGQIEVQGGQVNVGGKLWTRFEGQIPGATLLMFDDPNPSIHFSNIRVDGLAAGKTIKPFLRSGEWGFDVVSMQDAPVHVATSLGSASSLAEALPNFEVRSSSPNGTIALYNDTTGQVIQLADRVSTGDTSISLESPTLTLMATLSVNVSYRFETAGKLDLIFHSDDTGLDTLLRRIESTGLQGSYTQISEYWSTGALNIAGQSGEFILRLSNSGDPVLNLANLEIGSNVPEPAGLAVLGLAVLALKRRRRAA